VAQAEHTLGPGGRRRGGALDRGGHERLELWTAEYTERAADLSPRRVVDLGAANGGKVANGRWAQVRAPAGEAARLLLYDLSDGSHLGYWLPPDWSPGIGPVLYATDREVLLSVFRGFGEHTVMRLDLTAIPLDAAVPP